jgi:sugar lactone lactonase YvrE
MSASARILDRFAKSDGSDSIRILYPANVAYGGPDRRTLYITEAYSATILRAHVDAPGQPMFSHA